MNTRIYSSNDPRKLVYCHFIRTIIARAASVSRIVVNRSHFYMFHVCIKKNVICENYK